MISLGLAQDVLQENHDKFLPILFEPFIDREDAIWTEPFFFFLVDVCTVLYCGRG